jgi:chemotaxis-related protein WspB
MLLLVFKAGENRYGLEAREIVEVVPYPLCRALPQTSAWVAGLADYRGRTIPVVDLAALLTGRPARRLLSTRLVVVNYACPDGTARSLGLVAENAVETVRCREENFEPLPLEVREAPYLGATVRCEAGLLQRVTVGELLPAAIRERLFPPEEPA